MVQFDIRSWRFCRWFHLGWDDFLSGGSGPISSPKCPMESSTVVTVWGDRMFPGGCSWHIQFLVLLFLFLVFCHSLLKFWFFCGCGSLIGLTPDWVWGQEDSDPEDGASWFCPPDWSFLLLLLTSFLTSFLRSPSLPGWWRPSPASTKPWWSWSTSPATHGCGTRRTWPCCCPRWAVRTRRWWTLVQQLVQQLVYLIHYCVLFCVPQCGFWFCGFETDSGPSADV